MKDLSLSELMAKIKSSNVGILHALARAHGITPGTKRRQELIDTLIGVYTGQIIPEPRSKRGRPPKEVVDFEEDLLNSPVVSRTTEDLLPSNEDDERNEITETQDDRTSFKVSGILELMPDGFGFLRVENYSTTANKDVYVPPMQIKRFALKSGDKIEGRARSFQARSAPSIIFINKVNDILCADLVRATPFEKTRPAFPFERIKLETEKNEFALRAIDLVAPLGKGTRGLIVAPPKAGKTVLLKKIAQAIRKNHPELHLVVLLIGERPEEVTDFADSVDCEVAYSTFDDLPSRHVQIAELVVSNAVRRVEQGQEVVLLMDSITRLARAYNQTANTTGRTMTGGLDISALQEPKKLFGRGRKIQNGGSLTILATALIETGSKMDEIIYEEFKGTGNMEIHLDRALSEKRIFPAIDLRKSGTRREELLLTPKQLEGMYLIRKTLAVETTEKSTEELLDMLTCTNNNDEFIETLRLITKRSKR